MTPLMLLTRAERLRSRWWEARPLELLLVPQHTLGRPYGITLFRGESWDDMSSPGGDRFWDRDWRLYIGQPWGEGGDDGCTTCAGFRTQRVCGRVLGPIFYRLRLCRPWQLDLHWIYNSHWSCCWTHNPRNSDSARLVTNSHESSPLTPSPVQPPSQPPAPKQQDYPFKDSDQFQTTAAATGITKIVTPWSEIQSEYNTYTSHNSQTSYYSFVVFFGTDDNGAYRVTETTYQLSEFIYGPPPT